MSNATIIGEVAVKVRPSTDGFRGEAKRELTAIEKVLQDVRVDFEVNIEKLIHDTHDAVDKAQRRAGEIEIGVGLGQAGKKAVQAELAALTRRRKVSIAADLDKAAAAKVGSSLAALSGARALHDMGDDFAQWAGELDRSVPKIAGATLAVSNLGAALAGGTSNVLAFSSSLASTAGAALALPGIFGGLAIGAGATFAVLKDFNEQLPEVRERLGDLQDSMSERFWSRAKEPIRELTDELLPELESNLERTSDSLGGFFADLAGSTQDRFGGELRTMFDDLNESIDIASTRTDAYAGILEKLGSVGAGNLPRLAEWWGDLNEQFDDWLGRKGRAGLQEYVDTGIDALQDLGTSIRYASSTLYGLAKAAEAAGGGSLGALAGVLEDVSRTVNGREFQQNLTGVFEAAHLAMDGLTDEAGPKFRSLVLRIADLLQTTLPQAGQTAGKALGGIFDALDRPALQNSLEGAFDKLDTAVDNLTPSLDGVSDALAGIIDVIGDVTVNVSRGLAPALDTAAPAVEQLSDDLGPLVDALGDLLVNAVELASPLVDDLATATGSLAGEVATVIRPINAFVDLLQELPAPITGAMGHLASMGLLVGGAMWLGVAARAKVASFATSILDAGIAAGRAEGAFVRTAAAAENVAGRMTKGRTALLGASLALGGIQTDSDGANQALGVLSSTATGAVIGSAFGPVWGTAIGAAGGALVGLMSHTNDSSKAMDDAANSASRYVDTLNQLTGATTESTRARIYDNLEQSGALKVAQEYGVAARTVVDAVVGQKKAQAELGAVIATTRAEAEGYGQMAAQILADSNGSMSAAQGKQYQQWLDLQKQYDAAADSLEAQTGKLREDTKAMRERATAVVNYAKLFKGDGIPKAVITRFEERGIPATAAKMARLARKYDLLPKQVRTIIEETGSEVSFKRVKRLLEQLNVVDRTRANPEVSVDTAPAENRVKDTTNRVKDLDKITATSKVKIDDKATKPIKDVRQRLTEYAAVHVKATVDINDLASAKIAAIRAKLDGLRDKTVTVNQRTIVTGGRKDRMLLGAAEPKATMADVADMFAKTTSMWLDFAASMRRTIPEITAYWLKGLDAGIANVYEQIDKTIGKAEAKRDKARRKRDKERQKLDQFSNKVKAAEALVKSRQKNVDKAANAEARKQAEKQLRAARAQLATARAHAAKQQEIVNGAKEQVKAANKALAAQRKQSIAWQAQAAALEEALGAYERVNDQLNDAVSNLEALREEVKSYKRGLADAYQSTASILNAGSSFNSMRRFLNRNIEQLTEYNAGIEQLIGMGLNETVLDQIAQAGPDALYWIRSILKEGQLGVDELNALWGQVEGLSLDTGEAVGNYVFVDELAAASAEVDRLYNELIAMKKPIEDATNALLGAIAASAARNAEAAMAELRNLQAAFEELAKAAGVPVPAPPTSGSGSGGGGKGKPKKPKKPKKANTPKSATAARSSSQTLIYNAAPGKSLSSEEDLWDALGRAQGGW
ncbi:hypothetical protein [Nocardioides soli]|uniref:Tape measure protein n=1 Tax=Nocardioides soli TaxID=1036020 RepID=A0A7W4W0V8_9ACTN|nr:hypothetical protein [Nocardioides soli]MBB3044894.1 hypothetical protein [Nocardioides soli]